MDSGFSLLILTLGGIIIVTTLIRGGLRRMPVPSLVGFIVLGIIIRTADSHWGFISQEYNDTFSILANIGIIFLLFRVGLESNLGGLKRQLKRASTIWIGDVLISGGLGFAGAYFLLGLTLVQSLFIAVALTATSVAISVGVWHEAKAIKSSNGQLLVDLAEMDDISAIFLMAILFSVAPIFNNSGGGALAPAIGKAVGTSLVKFVGFSGVCILLSRYVERHITAFFKRLQPIPGQTVALAGLGVIIAALAGLIGFSVALGAFFAGLVFSRDPQAVKLDTPFTVLYDFIAPFFFINIGLNMTLGEMPSGLFLMVLVLLMVAFAGKITGAGTPALATTSWTGALLLGVSMVPRAEITMVIMQRGLDLGDWAVPSNVFSAMVVLSLVSAIVPPIILRPLLKRWHPRKEK
ncbi:MAG: cation:proton antiporter [Chloroflexota bacterium]